MGHLVTQQRATAWVGGLGTGSFHKFVPHTGRVCMKVLGQRRGANESSHCWLCLLWVSSATLQTCPTNMPSSHTGTSWVSPLGPWGQGHFPGDGFTCHTLPWVQGSVCLDAGIAG